MLSWTSALQREINSSLWPKFLSQDLGLFLQPLGRNSYYHGLLCAQDNPLCWSVLQKATTRHYLHDNYETHCFCNQREHYMHFAFLIKKCSYQSRILTALHFVLCSYFMHLHPNSPPLFASLFFFHKAKPILKIYGICTICTELFSGPHQSLVAAFINLYQTLRINVLGFRKKTQFDPCVRNRLFHSSYPYQWHRQSPILARAYSIVVPSTHWPQPWLHSQE